MAKRRRSSGSVSKSASIKFTSANVLAKFGESAVEAFDGGQDEDVGIVELKRFCTPRHAKTFSVKSIGHALGSLADAPVRVAGGALSLRSKLDGQDKIIKLLAGA